LTSATLDLSTDPGTEVLDHDGHGRSDLLSARAFTAGTSSTAARASSWSDYAWATWLPEVLRAAGVPVILEPGWDHKGRPRSVGPFLPRGVMWHEDASPKGPTPSNAKFIGEVGRPAEGIPAPLSQCWVCAGCKDAHAVGTWHVLAAGRANHAGAGQWGAVATDAGNTALLGVETDHIAGEPWGPTMLRSLQRGTAAILLHLPARPREWLCGHKEYAHGRKIDPAGLDMDHQREEVAWAMLALADGSNAAGVLVPYPGPQAFRLGHASPSVLRLERWLKLAGYLKTSPSAHYGPGTLAAVRAFQLDHDELRGDADGLPGPLTWELVQVAAARSAS
jgi:putative peptidoglycan binding protein/N-acetylmuramoyl-L-alanine amidase-like protein